MSKTRNIRHRRKYITHKKKIGGSSFEMVSFTKKRKPKVIAPSKFLYNLDDYSVFPKKQQKTKKRPKITPKQDISSPNNPFSY